ncbi:hypothetical protein M6B38_198540 [Iris pallida]|uniref:Uncharacterized protein n=1 Tax=Iris pallida TaxID=29817 RepID=A0AAX6EBG2_IRIPA|nr:hypothetical protein M6B38_198540 [Iris pallida]
MQIKLDFSGNANLENHLVVHLNKNTLTSSPILFLRRWRGTQCSH